jgi:hypothetical protein
MEIASVFTSELMKSPFSRLKHKCWCRLREWNLGLRLSVYWVYRVIPFSNDLFSWRSSISLIEIPNMPLKTFIEC